MPYASEAEEFMSSNDEDGEREANEKLESNTAGVTGTKQIESDRRSKAKSINLLKLILCKIGHRPVSTRSLVAAAQIIHTDVLEKNKSIVLRLLIQHNGLLPIHPDVLKAVVKNWKGNQMIEFLFHHQPNLEVTEEMMIESADAKPDYITAIKDHDGRQTVLEVIMRRRPHLRVSEEVIKTAAANDKLGVELVTVILNNRTDICVTEAVMMSAVQNSYRGDELVAMLLAHESDFVVSDKVIIAAAKNRSFNKGSKEGTSGIIKLLLSHNSIRITDEMLRAGMQNLYKSAEVVKALLAYRTDPISEDLMQEARAVILDVPDLLDALMEFSNSLVFSHEPDHRITPEEQAHPSKSPVTEIKAAVCTTCDGFNFSVNKHSHDMFMKNVIQASDAGCGGCMLIRQCVDCMVGSEKYEDMWLSLHSYAGPLELQINNDMHIELYMHADTPVFSTRIGVGSDISANASSDECMSLAISWLEECLTNHSKCPISLSPLPTRVIKVGAEHVEPVLHIAAPGEVARYAALSHCWGSSSAFTTITANIEERMLSIPFDNLPQTFQDAIIITRRLGIEYIWIDSLCIIQDSESDWNREAATMTEVYANSIVTIAADGLPDENGGCYAPFDSSCKSRNVSMEFPCVNSNGVECRVYARRAWDPSFPFSGVAHSVKGAAIEISQGRSVTWGRSKLSTRGWIFQERLLAPRTLHFSPTELAWECGTHQCCECGPVGQFDWIRDFKVEFFGENITPITPIPYTQASDIGEHGRWTRWQRMVSEFTTRTLSFASDRLPAISGLARRMQAGPEDEYICGLWRRNLVRELLWSVSTRNPSGFSQGSYRHEKYYAPTWSWASVTSPISYGGPWGDNWEEDLEILDIDYALSSPNIFGPVTHASITVRGILVPFWVHSPVPFYPNGNTSTCYSLQLSADDTSLQDPSILLQSRELSEDVFGTDDRYREIGLDEQLFLLTILRSTTSVETARIVLKQVDKRDNVFQRVGISGFTGVGDQVDDVIMSLWTEMVEQRTIVII